MEKTLPTDSNELDLAKGQNRQASITATILASATAIVFAADLLTWGQTPGLGCALFSIITGIIFVFNWKQNWKFSGTWIWLSTLVLVSIFNTLQTDAIGLFLTIALLLFGATQLAYPKQVPFWLKLFEGFTGLFKTLIEVPKFDLPNRARQYHLQSVSHRLFKLIRILTPAILLCIPFGFLFLSGNAVMRNIADNITLNLLNQIVNQLENIRPPSITRIIFWAILAVSSLGLLTNFKPTTTNFLEKKSLAIPKDQSLAIWRSRISLLMVNILYLFMNWTDLSFLWGNQSLPKGVSYSQFVHEGTWSLMICALLAAGVLSLLFFQHRNICQARGIRLLGNIWIIQNIVLVAGVIFRVKIYIEEYQLSLLRIYLMSCLALIAAGLLLLVIRIQWEKSYSWLISSNVVAIFIVLLFFNAWDEHHYVAKHNCAAIENSSKQSNKVLDLAYLQTLGPSAIPALVNVGRNPKIFGEKVAQQAKSHVNTIRKTAKSQKNDWRSFQFRSWSAIQSITSTEEEWLWGTHNPYVK